MAKRKRAQQTPNQREYAKQLQRIKNAVKRAEKRGYIFDSNVIPQTPKRITKSAIQRLKEITTTKLYAQAYYVIMETGEAVSGTEGRKIERKQSAEKAKRTRQKKKNKAPQTPDSYGYDDVTYNPDGGEIIYSNVYESMLVRLEEPSDYVINYRSGKRKRKLEEAIEASKRAKTTLLGLIKRVIADEGSSALGWRLEGKADEISHLIYIVCYDSKAENIMSAAAELATIIKGSALSMQELQDISEQEEYNEDWEAVE